MNVLLFVHFMGSFNIRTEQLRKLGKLLSYYLDKFNHKEVFIHHKQRMQSSIAVGTAEQGHAPSRSALFPGN
jgi:hypothetical protein